MHRSKRLMKRSVRNILKIGSEPGTEYVDACETIKKAMAEKEELEEKIAALKEN